MSIAEDVEPRPLPPHPPRPLSTWQLLRAVRTNSLRPSRGIRMTVEPRIAPVLRHPAETAA